VPDSHHTGTVKTIVGLSYELYCQLKLKQVLEKWRTTGRQIGSESRSQHLSNSGKTEALIHHQGEFQCQNHIFGSAANMTV